MTATANSSPHTPPASGPSRSLAGTTLFAGLGGAACLCVVGLIIFSGALDHSWIAAGAGLSFAAIAGFAARGLRRKIWFGDAVTFHQSLSFEAVVQAVHWVSPALSSRAFEREFLIRETGMARGDAEGWLAGRRLAIPVIACSAAAAVAWSAGVPVLASILASIAAVSLWVGARRMESSDGADRGATTHAASTLLGLCVWGIEGWLFVLATGGLLETYQSLVLYIGFTVAAEVALVPMAIGVAQLPALIAIAWGAGPTALGILLAFHGARIALLLVLGLVYLPRYKLTVDDLLDTRLITRLAASQRPAAGWQFEDDGSATCDLSLVIPAYNEAERLPPYLADIVLALEKTLMRWEVLVVDDGSSDRTADIVRDFSHGEGRVRLVRNRTNLGKGGAVAKGVLLSAGRYIIFADADGATPATEIDKILAAFEAGAEIAIGSRADSGDAATLRRHSLRAALGSTFYSLVNFFAVPGIRDTQCGFKGFRRDAAARLFDGLTETGWAFDVELLYRAQLTGYAIVEVPVHWQEKDGSKLNPFRDAIRMAVAIFKIRKHNAGFLRRETAAGARTQAPRPAVSSGASA